MNRRQMLRGTGMGLLAGAAGRAGVSGAESREQGPGSGVGASGSAPAAGGGGLELVEYQPQSMLEVRQTAVGRSRYPVIDIHTHITVSAKDENGVSLASERTYLGTPEELLAVMDRRISGRW